MADALPDRSTAEWIVALAARDVPCSEVNGLDALLTDPHLAEIGFFDVPEGFPEGVVRSLPQTVLFDGIATAPDTPPRPLGADSRAVLRGCGHSDDEIDALIAAGVTRAG